MVVCLWRGGGGLRQREKILNFKKPKKIFIYNKKNKYFKEK